MPAADMHQGEDVRGPSAPSAVAVRPGVRAVRVRHVDPREDPGRQEERRGGARGARPALRVHAEERLLAVRPVRRRLRRAGMGGFRI